MEYTLILFLLFILSIISLAITTSKQSKKQLNKLPPGPQKLPVIGNLHNMVVSNRHNPHRRLAELARAYGPIMHLQLGEVGTIIVSSADVAREVMKTHDVACCNRPELMTGKVFFYNSTDIGLAPYGEYWRQARKIATLEMFTSKRVGSFRSIREDEVGHLIRRLMGRAGSVVNLSELLYSLTFDISARVVFGKKGGKDEEAFRALTMEVIKVSSGFSMADLYPSSRLLYLISGMRRKLEQCVEEANKFLDPILEHHKLNKRWDDQDHHPLVDVLLNFHKDNVRGNNFSFTTDNIKAIILQLFGGANETSSTTVEWAMSELIKNPRVMRKAQEEVRKTFKINVVDESSLDKLNYLKLVIKETLRLHPPIPLLVPRETMEECQIQNHNLPIKTRIIINAWAIGRDPTNWSENECFIPERFENSSIDFKGTNFEFIPFGAGRRMCPGITLGIANVELPLAMLLYHFDWKLPNNGHPSELDMDESFGISVRRKNELQVIPIPYS